MVQIDWTNFTPWSAAAGGVLIGLAAGALVLLNGRLAGISGIVGGLLRPRAYDIGWRVAFLAGLAIAPWLYRSFASAPVVRVDVGLGTLAIAGLLVGVGTRYAAGCTSGHGVCGLARRSPRSLVATLVFMGTAMLTVYLARHV